MADPINPKVAISAAAAGTSTPLTVILIYYLNKWAGPMPPEIAAAYVGLITAAVGFLGGWLTRLEPKLLPPEPSPPAPVPTSAPAPVPASQP